MKNRIIITSLIIIMFFGFSCTGSFALKTITDKNVSELQGKKKFKRMKAYFRYRNEDYNGALRIYRDIYKGNEKDAKLNLMIGKCNLMLQNMDEALVYLKLARKLKPGIDKELPFFMGQAYQYLGKLDSAIIEYNTYQESLPKSKLHNNPVKELISQAETTKNMKIAGQETEIIVEGKLSILKGSVLESSAAQKVDADVIIKDAVSGKVITTVQTNEAGDYYVTLNGDKEYEIVINKEGYKPFDEKVMLPAEAEKTFSLVKLIVLEKLPEEKK